MKHIILTAIILLIARGNKAQSVEDVLLVKSISDDLKKYYGYIEYGIEVEEAVSDGKPVPQPPFLRGEENEKLDELIQKLDNELQALNNMEPVEFSKVNFEPCASGKLEACSESHTVLLNNLSELSKKHGELVSTEKEITAAIALTTEIYGATRTLSDALWEAYRLTGHGFSELSNMFGFKALSLSEVTLKQLARIKNRLNRAKKKISSQEQKLRSQKSNYKENMSVILSAHEKALNDSLQILAAKVKLFDANTKLWLAKFELNEKNIEQNEEVLSKLRQQKANLIEMKADIDFKKSDVQSYEESILRKETEKGNLSFCPRGYSFEECKHDDNKAIYVAESSRLSAEIEALNSKKTQLNEELRELVPRYKREAANFNSEVKDTKAELARQYKEKEELMSAREKLSDKFFRFMELRGKYNSLLEQNLKQQETLIDY